MFVSTPISESLHVDNEKGKAYSELPRMKVCMCVYRRVSNLSLINADPHFAFRDILLAIFLRVLGLVLHVVVQLLREPPSPA